MRLLTFLLAVAALAGGLVWNQYRASGHEQALAAVAGEIAGRDVAVHCQGLPSELLDIGWQAGEVHFDASGRPADETRLDRSVCRELARFREIHDTPAFDCVRDLSPCDRETARIAYAPHLLAHEAWHLRGIANEARAECYALQTTAWVAAELGADESLARAVAVWNLRHAYPTLPEPYRSAACRDGGALDLKRGTWLWP